jgi:DNA sulfur modification protein DndB
MTATEWLNPIVSDLAALRREASSRRKPFQELSIRIRDIEDHVEQGWEVVRMLKRKALLRRPWPHEERLENRAWSLFYLLGYPEISSGRQFKVRIERRGAESYWKQIDVLAKDDETVIVAECKSCAQVTRRSLQKDIEEFSSLQKPIANAIRYHYGREFKPKIVWLFITHNIVWSSPDKQRALGANINIVDERQLRYYIQIADHLRSAARFQFLAEFLKDQKIPEMENVKIPAVRGRLGGRPFFSFVSTPRQMLKIAFVNHRSLNDPEGAPTYQRLVSRARLRQIGRYLEGGGFFPTNILVNFSRPCRFEVTAHDEETNVAFGNLYLPCRYRSAWIIDGQHRLYGYAPLSEKQLSENILVVAFDCLDRTEEANLFVTINHEQKTVPKTLLDDLEGELKWGSDKPSERVGAISARLIGLLNNDIGGPLYLRVTQQGIKATDKICLTVPELKNGLRRSGLVGSPDMKGKEYAPGPLSGVTDGETLERAQAVLTAYFECIKNANEGLWESGRPGYLATNTGIQAYLLLLSALLTYLNARNRVNVRELEPLEVVVEIEEYLRPITNWLKNAKTANMAEAFRVQFGSGGPTEYYYRLCRIINEHNSDFEPNGYAQWREVASEQRINRADWQIKELNKIVQRVIFDTFKEKYGVDQDAYWHKGVIDKNIRANAYSKSLDDDDEDRLPLENYLEFIEYKKIVEHREHWRLFRDVFDIPEPSEKGRTKNLKWMEKVNELRRVSAHPTESRRYKNEDFEYLDYVFTKLEQRLNENEVDRGGDDQLEI